MSKTTIHYDFIIAGAGASGLMFANELIESPKFSNHKILILEKDHTKYNDRTWCFWEESKGKWDKLLYQKWDQVQFKNEKKTIPIQLYPFQYKMLRSSTFYELLHQKIKRCSNIDVRYEEIINYKDFEQHVEVTTGEKNYHTQKFFSSILKWSPLFKQQKYPVLQQHFLGWFIKTKTPHFKTTEATFMDFSVPQKGNTRFMYVLPVNKTEALIEYTLFSKEVLKKEEYESALTAYLLSKEIDSYTVKEVEQGSIPMSLFSFNQLNTKNIMHIGSAGGWTKASTGFTFKNIERKSNALVSFLENNDDLRNFNKRNRFWFYDLLFIDVLDRNNALGSSLFSKMFQRNSPGVIFRFLDEKTRFWEEVKLMSSFPTWIFIKAFLIRLFKGF